MPPLGPQRSHCHLGLLNADPLPTGMGLIVPYTPRAASALERQATPGRTRHLSPDEDELCQPARLKTTRPTGTSETPRPNGPEQEIQHIQLKLKAISGRIITLQCRWMKRDAAWKWFAETQGVRLHHQGKNTPGTILLEWLQRFDQHLTDEGVREIESALAIHPDPPHGPPDSLNRTPAGSDQMAGTPAAPSTPALARLPGAPRGPRVPATPVSVPMPGPEAPTTWEEARLPSDSADRCIGCHFWLGKAVPTQRQLPKTSREIVDTACHRLLLLLGETKRHGHTATCPSLTGAYYA